MSEQFQDTEPPADVTGVDVDASAIDIASWETESWEVESASDSDELISSFEFEDENILSVSLPVEKRLKTWRAPMMAQLALPVPQQCIPDQMDWTSMRSILRT